MLLNIDTITFPTVDLTPYRTPEAIAGTNAAFKRGEPIESWTEYSGSWATIHRKSGDLNWDRFTYRIPEPAPELNLVRGQIVAVRQLSDNNIVVAFYSHRTDYLYSHVVYTSATLDPCTSTVVWSCNIAALTYDNLRD